MSITYFDEKAKLWSGFYSPIVFNPKISLGHAILWTLGKNSNKIVQVIMNIERILLNFFLSQNNIFGIDKS